MAGGYPLLSVGFNCVGVSVGLEPRLKALAATITCCTSVHPSAGIPDDQGSYHDTPEDMMLSLDSLLEEGLLNFAGGCCGTTPEFIAMLEKVAAKATPRQISR